MMGTQNPDGLEAANILTRLADALPDASPLAQACFLALIERDEARLAALAKVLDLPQAMALRGVSELVGLVDDAQRPIAIFTPGANPGSGVLRLTPEGVLLAKRLLGRTARTDH